MEGVVELEGESGVEESVGIGVGMGEELEGEGWWVEFEVEGVFMGLV